MDEQITDDPTRYPRNRGADRVVIHAGEKVDLLAVALQAAVGVAAAPVLFYDLAIAQVLDTGAAHVDQVGIGTGLGQVPERPSKLADHPLERGARLR